MEGKVEFYPVVIHQGENWCFICGKVSVTPVGTLEALMGFLDSCEGVLGCEDQTWLEDRRRIRYALDSFIIAPI